ncbi:MAG: hypothetical protein ABJF10_29790 [Chthoniobacter sp.]|uniref:hypothetical protein n=1 Tax=Chthoniobacter sp. TaxID=2510640 RepID=UPI0032A7E3B3
MNQGEFLTRLSIWLALIAYVVAAGMMLHARGREPWWGRARWAWTIGCGFFLCHLLCAFAYFHHWSHAEAYGETARQTAALTGWHWGGGIYFNYVFAAAWLADTLWWWVAPQSFVRRPMWVTALWHGFFFFMVFNGTIVFGHGPVRVLGVVISLTLTALWQRRRKGHPRTKN